ASHDDVMTVLDFGRRAANHIGRQPMHRTHTANDALDQKLPAMRVQKTLLGRVVELGGRLGRLDLKLGEDFRRLARVDLNGLEGLLAERGAAHQTTPAAAIRAMPTAPPISRTRNRTVRPTVSRLAFGSSEP